MENIKLEKILKSMIVAFLICNITIQGISAQSIPTIENEVFKTEKSIAQISDKPNEEEFEIELKINKKPNAKANQRKIDLEIAFDNSASMNSINGNDTVFADSKKAVKKMISGLDTIQDRVGLTPYKGSRRIGNDNNSLPYSVDTKVSLTNNLETVESEIDNMTAIGETPMYSGVKNAIQDLKKNSRPDAEKKLIIVSDGDPTASTPIIRTIPKKTIVTNFLGEEEEDYLAEYGRISYDYRYAKPEEKVTDRNIDFGPDSFYYRFNSDKYRLPEFIIKGTEPAAIFDEGGFEFLRQEVRTEIEKAKSEGIDVYVVYVQRYDENDPRYEIDSELYKKTSIDFMKSLASGNDKFFTIDGLNTNGELANIFKQIKEKVRPKENIITDEIIDEFDVVPNSFEAKLDGVDKTKEISPTQDDKKLTWNFNDEAKDEYELILKYRIKRNPNTKSGTYITSKRPAELSYKEVVDKVSTIKNLQFPDTKATVLDTGITEETTDKTDTVDEIDPIIAEKPLHPQDVKEGTVIIKYLEKQTNKELKESKTIKGTQGQSYLTKADDIKDYVLVKKPENASGQFDDGKKQVIYYYSKLNTGITEETTDKTDTVDEIDPIIPEKPLKPEVIKEGTVIIKYLEKQTNKEIKESKTIKGTLGQSYLTKADDIKDYVLVKKPDNASGQFDEGKKEVIYYYSKLNTGITEETTDKTDTVDEIDPIIPEKPLHPQDIKEGTVIIKYLEKGTNKEIKESKTIKGTQGQSYITKADDIKDYVLVKKPENASGQFEHGKTEVIYYYSKLNTGITEETTDKTDTVDEIDPIIPEKPLHPQDIKEGTVIIKYLEKQTNKELKESKTIKGTLGQSYLTKADDIKDYVLVKKPENASGQFEHGKKEVIYYYSKLNTGITEETTDKTDTVDEIEPIIPEKPLQPEVIKEGTAEETKPIKKVKQIKTVENNEKKVSYKSNTITKNPKTGDEIKSFYYFAGALIVLIVINIIRKYKNI